MARDAEPFMRPGTRGPLSWPSSRMRPDTLMHAGQTRLTRPPAGTVGHMFALATERWGLHVRAVKAEHGRHGAGGCDSLEHALPAATSEPSMVAVADRGERPQAADISRQPQPVLGTCRMPLMTWRSSTRGLPDRPCACGASMVAQPQASKFCACRWREQCRCESSTASMLDRLAHHLR